METQPTNLESAEAVDRTSASSSRPHGNAVLVKRIQGINVVDFSDVIGLYESLPAHRKLLLLVLLLNVRDQASEVRFEPGELEPEGRSLRLFAEVNGQLHELMPPPPHLTDTILQEVRDVAGFTSPRRRLAGLLRRLANRFDTETQQTSHSRFQMRAGTYTIEIATVIHGSPRGDRIFLSLPSPSDSISQKAREALQAIHDRRTS